MIPVSQTNFTKHGGNCLTACVASILELPIDAVPEFCVDGEWFDRLYQFCESHGFFLIYWREQDIPHPPMPLNAYVIVALKLQGTEDLHAVVCKAERTGFQPVSAEEQNWTWEARVVHDPNTKGVPPSLGPAFYVVIGRQ
jgi:hypothetical protein